MDTFIRSVSNWKTTLTGGVAFIVYLLGQFGVVITPEQSQAIVVVLLMVLGFLAKDATTGSAPK